MTVIPLWTITLCSHACAASCVYAYLSFVFDHCMIILADVFVFPPVQSNYPPMLDEGKFAIVLLPGTSNHNLQRLCYYCNFNSINDRN